MYMMYMYILIQNLLLISVKLCNCFDIVEQWNKWPVPVESIVKFTINKQYTNKSEVLIKVVNVKGDILSHKPVLVTKRNYVDLSTDYFVIKKEKILNSASFFLQMSFFKKSYGNYLSIDWVESVDKPDKVTSMYKELISLTRPWRIDIKVQVLDKDRDNKPNYIDDMRFFQPGKKVKVSCSAYDGLPPAPVFVDDNLRKKFREVTYDEALNQWIGYLILAVGDHNHSVTCRVSHSSQNKSHNIIVNHPTTSLQLSPEYDGYTKNGTIITCQPHDGYPAPIIKWDFVAAKNRSNPKSLYEISNEELHISPSAPIGTEMEFNCSAVYTNPLDNKETTVSRSFGFIVGDFLLYTTIEPSNATKSSAYANLNIAAIGASLAGLIIMIIAVTIVIMLCRSKPKTSRCSSNQQQGSPKYAGSLLAGSKSALRNQVKSHNGSNAALMSPDSSTTANTDKDELNYDDMPRGRRPIKVVDDPVIYSTIVGTMQPKSRPSLDLGPIDRV